MSQNASKRILSLLFAGICASLCALPAHADPDDDLGPQPSPMTSQATWLFSWTMDPAAAANPSGHTAKIIQNAQGCFSKIAAQKGAYQDIPGCQGDGMAAGPGMYFADNPFTSHDYGNILVYTRTRAGDGHVVDVSDSMRQADVIDPDLSANPNIKAIVYAFRASDLGTNAIVVRDSSILDVGGAIVNPAVPKEFNSHPAYACTNSTSFFDAYRNWADQIDFMSIVFNRFNDPTGGNFGSGQGLNQSGWLAALAGNIAAAPADQINAKVARLSAASNELKESLKIENCSQVLANTPRSCLAHEFYVSLVGDNGSTNFPTGAWTFPALKKALLTLGIISATDAATYNSLPAMQKFLAARFQTAKAQAARAQEAFHCTEVIRAQLAPQSLAHWPRTKN